MTIEVKITSAPTRMVSVVVFDTTTGHIQKRCDVPFMVAHMQHLLLDGHDFLITTDIHDFKPHPNDHKVDLVTKRIVPRTAPTDWDKAVKLMEIHTAHRDAVTPNFDVVEVQLGAALGDAAATAKAKAHLQDRKAANAKRDALLAATNNAQTKAALLGLKWS